MSEQGTPPTPASPGPYDMLAGVSLMFIDLLTELVRAKAIDPERLSEAIKGTGQGTYVTDEVRTVLHRYTLILDAYADRSRQSEAPDV